MEKTILDLSGLYAEEGIEGLSIDDRTVCLKDLEGTNCYCDPSAAKAVREAIKDSPVHAVHWIDTGDYHYLSLFWLEKAAAEIQGKPFALVLFDHHPDMQEPAFDGVISCGGWVRDAFNGVEGIGQVLLLGINPDLELEFLDMVFDGVLAVTSEDFMHTGDAVGKDVNEMISLLDPGIPVYVSIDLDVLSTNCVSTNWDQGNMTLKQLETVLDTISASHEIIGVDICGGLTREKGADDAQLERNACVRRELSSFVDNLLER